MLEHTNINLKYKSPNIFPLLSSTNGASSSNWSRDQLGFRIFLSLLSFIMIGGLERQYGLILKVFKCF